MLKRNQLSRKWSPEHTLGAHAAKARINPSVMALIKAQGLALKPSKLNPREKYPGAAANTPAMHHTVMAAILIFNMAFTVKVEAGSFS